MTGYTINIREGNNADITLLQGKTIDFYMVWGGNSPIDVTGYDACLQIRESVQNVDIISEFNIENGRVSIGGPDGRISLHMNAEESAALPAPSSGVYELEIKNADGTVYRGMYGNLKVEPEVAR
jgi:tRNA threonylcarbamoyladenosine modification (KEOPS) complex  Pcc1 subunit